MRKIFQLPDHIVAKIAAGEVIERPVYAVKELVENSLDANADTISILIENAGLQKISVTDNGEGMSEEDLLESFKPHTTSKLHDDQLHGIATLGFRGEALASIAAVSNLIIKSKVENATAGTVVELRAGNLEKVAPIGMPTGTTVTIENLFYPVPARQKFLKSARTEFRHIADLIMQYALTHPDKKFTLIHNGKTVIDLPKNQETDTRIRGLLGQTIFEQLIPVTFSDAYISFSGFLAKPQITTRSQTKQFLFVNKRTINDKLISGAVKDAYGNLLEPTNNPVFIAFLQLPHETVDVNVHPRKEHVQFTNSKMVYDAVFRAVKQTLEKHNLTFLATRWNAFSPRAGEMDSETAQLLRESVKPWEIPGMKIRKQTDPIQIDNLYLIFETEQGMMLVDQHAAHERILFEQYEKEFKNQKAKMKSISLAKPFMIELSVPDAEMLQEKQKDLKQFGFDIEEFRDAIFKINAIPELFQDRNIEQLLRELLENFQVEKDDAIDLQSMKIIEFLACRTAIKAGDRLTKKQAKELIAKLENTENNATCPHGRPTKVAVSMNELNRMFKR